MKIPDVILTYEEVRQIIFNHLKNEGKIPVFTLKYKTTLSNLSKVIGAKARLETNLLKFEFEEAEPPKLEVSDV